MFRIVLSVFVGAVIVGEFGLPSFGPRPPLFPAAVMHLWSAALNFTCDWAEARMTTRATYKSFSSVAVHADIGLHVGLYGINVTLRGESLPSELQALLFCILSQPG